MGSSDRFARSSKYFAECFTPSLKEWSWPLSRLVACSAVVLLRTRDPAGFILMRKLVVIVVLVVVVVDSGSCCWWWCCFGTEVMVMFVRHVIPQECP